jgi:hypothetical protein
MDQITQNENIKKYTTRNGVERFKPSLSLLEELNDNSQGFCIACGEISDSVEPDASGYQCEHCGQNKVSGPATLAISGICF